MCEKCGRDTHRDDAMNRRCNGCEHLVRQCICEVEHLSTVRNWLLGYAWLGTEEEQVKEVDCILSQDGWKYIAERADQFAGAQFESGPEAFDEGLSWALSALYECHDEPHLETCPRKR